MRTAACKRLKIAVKAIVRQLTDVEASALNGRENIARNDLRVGDRAQACRALQMTAVAAGLSLSQAQIGNQLGISQTYVSGMLQIAVQPFFAEYRGMNNPPDFWKVVKICKEVNEDRKIEAFRKLCGIGNEESADVPVADAGDKFPGVEKLAKTLATLVYWEVISTPDFTGGEFLAAIYSGKKLAGLTPAKKKRATKLAIATFDAALAAADSAATEVESE